MDAYTTIKLSKSALTHNFDAFADLTKQQIIPVIKSNAYGHGIEWAVGALAEKSFPYFAVQTYPEARRVRAVTDRPVLICGPLHPTEYRQLTADDAFAFVVSDRAAITALAGRGWPLKVHLECNIAMNRYGVRPGEVAEYVQMIQAHSTLQLEGIMGHLADSEAPDQAIFDQAVATFDRCVESARAAGASPVLIHVAQTAGSVRAQSRYAHAVRIGLGLYGVNPFSPDSPYYSRLDGLQPALQLTSTITKIIQLAAGEGVGYNHTFVAKKPTTIGVLPLGYNDAVPFALSNQAVVKVNNRYCPVAGLVCMNVMMIDLGDTPVKVGDKVIVYSSTPGDKNTIEATENTHGLSRYELLTRLNADIPRVDAR